MYIQTTQLDRLQKMRQMTNIDLAKLCGVSRQAICKIRKTERCRPITARRMAEALNVPLEEILKPEERN